MKTEDKVQFLKALENDTDFAKDVISLLMPHMVHMIDTEEYNDDDGNLDGVEISISNFEVDKRTNRPAYCREIEAIAHKVWGNISKSNRNYSKRADFVDDVVKEVLVNDDVFRSSETITEVEFKVRPNIELLERITKNGIVEDTKAKVFVKVLRNAVKTVYSKN